MTDTKYSAGALACLVDLKNPPPRPEDAYGEWKGGWIDYDGKLIMIGRVKGIRLDITPRRATAQRQISARTSHSSRRPARATV